MEPISFDAVHTEYRPIVRRYLEQMLSSSDVDDATQQVFMKVHKALDSFRGESKLSTWILRIATTTAIDLIRGRGEALLELKAASEVPAPGKSAEELTAKNEMNRCIQGRLQTLSPAYRSVLSLAELDGCGTAEIAEILNVSASAVKVRLHRARKLLKTDLQNHCCFYRDEDNHLACDPL